MPKTIEQDAIEITYRDVEALINKICWTHLKKMGGEFDEIKAQANMLFLSAYNSTDDVKSSFITWMFISIKYGLMSWTRNDWRRCKHQKKIQQVIIEQTPEFYDPEPFNETHPLRIEAEYNESETIRTVLNLVFDPPDDLVMNMSHYEDPVFVRESIKMYLRLKLGWSKERVNLAFKEIRRLINVHQAFAVSE